MFFNANLVESLLNACCPYQSFPLIGGRGNGRDGRRRGLGEDRAAERERHRLATTTYTTATGVNQIVTAVANDLSGSQDLICRSRSNTFGSATSFTIVPTMTSARSETSLKNNSSGSVVVLEEQGLKTNSKETNGIR